MVSYSSVCPALGLLLALSAFCSAQQAATQNPVAVAEAQNKYSKQVADCAAKGTALDKCIVDVTKTIQPEMVKGVPEFQFPSLVPLKLAKIPVEIKSPSLELHGELTDVETTGIDKFELVSVVPEAGTNSVLVKFKIPEAKAHGNYELKGNVLVLPLQGKGKVDFAINGVTIDVKVTLARQGPSSVKFEKINITINLTGGNIHLEGLQGEGDSVGEAMNNLMNENFIELAGELGPIYNAVVFDVIQRAIAIVIAGISPEEFTKAGLKL